MKNLEVTEEDFQEFSDVDLSTAQLKNFCSTDFSFTGSVNLQSVSRAWLRNPDKEARDKQESRYRFGRLHDGLRLMVVVCALFTCSWLRTFTAAFVDSNSQRQWFDYPWVVTFLLLNWLCDILDLLLVLAKVIVLSQQTSQPIHQALRAYCNQHWTHCLDFYLGIFPFEVFALATGSIECALAMRIIKLAKVPLTARNVIESVTAKLNEQNRSAIAKGIFWTISSFVVWIYVYACLWFALYPQGWLERKYGLWSDRKGIQVSVISACIESVYFVVVTMCTVGYGDLVPENGAQVFLSFLIQSTGFVHLSLIIGSLVPLVYQTMLEEVRFTTKKNIVLRYFANKGIEPFIRDKTMQFYMLRWDKRIGSLDETRLFNENIPYCLRKEIGPAICGTAIRNDPLFSDAPAGFIKALCSQLIFEWYMTGDIIFNSEAVVSHLAVLLQGEVEEWMLDENEASGKTVVKQIPSGRPFAQIEFVTGEPSSNYFSSTVDGTQVALISRDHWKQLLQQYLSVADHVYRMVSAKQQAQRQQVGKRKKTFVNDDEQNAYKSIEGLYYPNSPMALRWSALVCLATLIILWCNTILICFTQSHTDSLPIDSWVVLALLWSVDCFIALNIYARMHKLAVSVGDKIVSDPDTVKMLYRKSGELWIDLAAIFPLDLLAMVAFLGSHPNLWIWGRINRTLLMYRLPHYLGRLMDLYNLTGSRRNAVLSLISLLNVTNILACLWYLVGSLSGGSASATWIAADTVLGSSTPTIVRYLRSFYFTMVTSFTVGYGGIVPVNSYEKVVCLSLVLLGTSQFFFIMALITVFAEQINALPLQFQRTNEVTKYTLNTLGCPLGLKKDVRSYLSQLWNQAYGRSDEEVLSLLPRSLQQFVLVNFSLGVLECVPFFANELPLSSDSFLDDLVSFFKVRSYCPLEIISAGNRFSDFFIVYSGSCTLTGLLKPQEETQETNQETLGQLPQSPSKSRNKHGRTSLFIANLTKDGSSEHSMTSLDSIKVDLDASVTASPTSSEFDTPKEGETSHFTRNFKSGNWCGIQALQLYNLLHSSSNLSNQAAIAGNANELARVCCPYRRFQLQADEQGFVTLITLSNEDFERALDTYPSVRKALLVSLGTGQRSNTLTVGLARRISAVRNSTAMVRLQSGAVYRRSSRINGNSMILDNESLGLDQVKSAAEREAVLSTDDDNDETIALNSGLHVTGTRNEQDSVSAELGLIHPLSSFKAIWNVLSLIGLLYQCIIVPYRVAFICPVISELSNQGLTSLLIWTIFMDFLIDCFFVSDIYLRMYRLTYFAEGGFLETNKAKILAKYTRIQWLRFLTDICSSVPWDTMVLGIWLAVSGDIDTQALLSYFWMRLLRLLRLSHLIEYVNGMEAFIDDRKLPIKPTVIRISSQLCIVLLVCHWGACLFYLVSANSLSDQYNWLTDLEFVPDRRKVGLPIDVYYLRSLYWSLITMAGVGFGDIKPRTLNETLSGLIFVFVGSVVFAASTAFIASFAAHSNPPAEAFREQSQPVLRFLRSVMVSNTLVSRTQQFFNHNWQLYKGVGFDKSLHSLSDSLKARVQEWLISEHLRKHQLFKSCSSDMIHQITHLMIFEVLVSGEKCCVQGNSGDRMIVVLGGSLQYVSGPEKGKSLGPGKVVNAQALTNHRFVESGTLQAKEAAQICWITRERFCRVLKQSKSWTTRFLKAALAHRTYTEAQSSKKGISKAVESSGSVVPTEEENSGSLTSDEPTWVRNLSTFFHWGRPVMLTLNYWLNCFVAAYAFQGVWPLILMPFLWIGDVLIFQAEFVFRLCFTVPVQCGASSSTLTVGERVRLHWKHRRNYVIFMTVSLIPIDMVMGTMALIMTGDVRMVAEVRTFCRFLFLGRWFSSLHELLTSQFNNRDTAIQCFEITLCVYLVLHNAGCFWELASQSNYSYLRSLYYAMTVVSTTGYGDIVPETTLEIWITLIIVFVGNLMYAGVLGAITATVTSANRRSLDQMMMRHSLVRFAELHKLNPVLTQRLLGYHERSLKYEESREVLESMPDKLRKQCTRELYGSLLSSLPCFVCFGSQIMAELANHLQIQVFPEGDLIHEFGETNNLLYVVISGSVFVVSYELHYGVDSEADEEDKEVKPSLLPRTDSSSKPRPKSRHRLKPSRTFGEHSFFMAEPCRETVFAAEDCEVLTLPREALRDICVAVAENRYLHSHERLLLPLNREEEDDEGVPTTEGQTLGVPDSSAAARQSASSDDGMKPAHPLRSNRLALENHPFVMYVEFAFSHLDPFVNPESIQRSAKIWKISSTVIMKWLDSGANGPIDLRVSSEDRTERESAVSAEPQSSESEVTEQVQSLSLLKRMSDVRQAAQLGRFKQRAPRMSRLERISMMQPMDESMVAVAATETNQGGMNVNEPEVSPSVGSSGVLTHRKLKADLAAVEKLRKRFEDTTGGSAGCLVM